MPDVMPDHAPHCCMTCDYWFAERHAELTTETRGQCLVIGTTPDMPPADYCCELWTEAE
jgi:hypothetical protein